MNWQRIITAVLFTLIFVASAGAQAPKKSSTPLTLQAAAERGWAEYSLAGTGGSSGDSVTLTIRKTAKASGPLTVVIPPGSFLRSSDVRAQSMVVSAISGIDLGGGLIRPSSRILLSGNSPVTFILSAFCAEFDKENPSRNTAFSLGSTEPTLACITSKSKQLSVPAEQAAVWMFTNGISFEHMNQKLSVERTDWSAAEEVVRRCRTSVTDGSSGPQRGLFTKQERFGYAVGLNLGKSLRKESVVVDPDSVLQGLKDGLAGRPGVLTDEEAQSVLKNAQADMREKGMARTQEAAERNKRESDTFLAANKIKEGVVSLPSGLQYKVLKEGSGPKPSSTDSVVCNYTGTLLDGTEFDSSFKRGAPATFPVSAVIKGWMVALQLMPVGSKWQLFVPSDLAYEARSAGPQIGPNSTLLFEVELLSIENKK